MLANEQHRHDGGGSTTRLSKHDQEDIDAINSTLDRMRHFTPTDPYVLTIPQTVEPRYHHSYRQQADQWLTYTPFDKREHEMSQYQTFVYHEPGRTIYEQHSTRPPAEMDKSAGERSVRAGNTGANTPVAGQGGPKKTMSFGAYKKKQTVGTPTPDVKDVEQHAKQPAVKGAVERLKADEDMLAAVGQEEDVVSTPLGEEKRDRKRKRGDDAKQMETAVPENQEVAEDDEPGLKKARRTSPPPTTKEQNQDQDQVKQVEQPASSPDKPTEDLRLPPRLSPPCSTSEETAAPDQPSDDDIPPLPPRLSPTLPANILATLNARAHFRSTSQSSELSIGARHLTPPPNGLESGVKKRKSPIPKNAFRANSSSPAFRSDVEERGRPRTSMPPRPRTPADEVDAVAEESDEIAVARAKPKKPELKVTFKFRKSKRETFRRIVKMRPNPAKESTMTNGVEEDTKSTSDQRHRERRSTNAKGVAQKVGTATPATNGVVSTKHGKGRPPSAENERERSDDGEESEEPSAERKKACTDDSALTRNHKEPNRPSTPVQPDRSLLSPFSAQKTVAQQQLTPHTMRKDVLSAAMKRELSQDSNTNVGTPSASAIPQNSPSASRSQATNNMSQPPPSSQPSNKTPKQQAWETEMQRLEALGKELKYAADAHFKSLSLVHSDPNGPATEQKLAAVKAIESFLAFTLAFTCADEAAQAADPKKKPTTTPWRSLRSFYAWVKKTCEQYQLLVGLACGLTVVVNAHLLDLIRQQRPTGGDEGKTIESITETLGLLQRAANEADSKLDIEALMTNFPRSWEGRSRTALPAVERMDVGHLYDGPYRLPLGMHCPPLRAVRAGHAMLREWIDKEGGEQFYEMKLRL